MELAVTLDESAPQPLYRQLYDGLRTAILSGRLPSGQRLPSTRLLSRQLNVSRNTVTQAYGELEAEGYLCGRHGSGTYVSGGLLEERIGGIRSDSPTHPPIPQERSLRPSSRPARYAASEARRRARALPYDFHPGQGAWDTFPKELWRRLLGRQWSAGWREAMDYGDPAGYEPLRQEIALYLARSRGVRCTSDQVVVVNGTQQALDLLARLLLDPGDPVAVEDPGYSSARQVFGSYRARLVPIPVGQEGMEVERLRGTGARIALVTPSHQFPTGATLSLSRRLSLLGWARAESGLVVEDDYDSEFRFEGQPLASLQGLDDSGSVVYLGSFSKVLYPSLRVGYAVLPPDLVGPFVDAKELTDRQTPMLEQQVLAAFLGEGHFERHLRRMRQLYRQRRSALVAALERHLSGRVRVRGSSAGMHLLLELTAEADEETVAGRAAVVGVGVYPAGPYYCEAVHVPSLILGYAGMSEERIREGVALLATVLQPQTPSP